MNKVVALLLAVINAAVGLTLLLLSGWFIAASAVAGMSAMALNFNYVIPSTVIRLLAFVRILSGYGEKYVGHAALFDQLGHLREKLFVAVMHDQRGEIRANELEKLTVHVEALANFNLSYLHPNLSALLLAIAISITLLMLAPGQLSVFMATMLLVIGLMIVQHQRIRSIKKRLRDEQSGYRFKLEHYLRSAPLWNYQQSHQDLQEHEQQWLDRQLQLQQRQQQSEWYLLLLSIVGLLAAIYTVPGTLTGSPYALLVLLVYVAVPDWLGNALRAIAAGIDSFHARRILTDIAPATSERKDRTPATRPVTSMQLQQFCWQRDQLTGTAIELNAGIGDLIWIKGSSGSGKSSLLLALASLLPHAGDLLINRQPATTQRLSTLLYTEQFPYVLSDSLRNNLLLADPEADEATLVQALTFARLESLLPEGLDQWLGDLGRELSGGEKKRLGLARAWLSDAPVWLLDEPFEGLDQSSQQAMITALNNMRQQHIILIASHIEPFGVDLSVTVDLDRS